MGDISLDRKLILRRTFTKKEGDELALLNYTTTIDVQKTLGEIQKALVTHGAKRLMYDYSDNGRINSLCFTILTADGEKGIKLPANVQAIYEVFSGKNKRER
jgi:hypothetical protein